MLLMIISCSMLISAYRSLNRNFSGVVVKKFTSPGLSFDQYWLFLLPDSEVTTSSGSNAILNALTKGQQIESDAKLNRVGVSAVVFAEASTLSKVEKESLSPFIKIQSETYIDLGINWFLFGFAGVLLSIWMYLQTLKQPTPSCKYESEDIEVPGL